MATKAEYRAPVQLTGLRHGGRYSFHEGTFAWSEDVEKSPVKKSGVMQEPTLDLAPVEDHFGYIFTGFIDIPEDGIWSFSLTSDDGAILEIDGTLVVDNDGSHSAITTFGRIPLLKGMHPYKIIYLEDYEGQELRLAWRAEGEKRFSPIPKENLYLPDFPYPHFIL